MRFPSVTPYGRRFQGKNQRTDICERLSMSGIFNRLFSVNSHAYLEHDCVETKLSFDDILLLYPATNYVNIVVARARIEMNVLLGGSELSYFREGVR